MFSFNLNHKQKDKNMTKSTFSNSINVFINRYRLKQLRPFLLPEKVVLWPIKSAVHPTTNSPSLFIVKYRLEILLTALYVFIYFFTDSHHDEPKCHKTTKRTTAMFTAMASPLCYNKNIFIHKRYLMKIVILF